ncbi:hypothetical protein GTP91_02530 [Rugamonas sp. FT82W]|uniref:Lipoprotein n=1 Tax=Duganella vulcania TaxID=2692166 RepID=A0A845FZA2_9BURK|nr:hypothetical protein [Duganella vulcania]MYM86049.1 hypothetical protein [Duganella vulcania]
MYQQSAAILLIPLLWGCGRAPAAADVPMKSATYYEQHPQEAAQVATRCNLLNEQQQRKLSARDYQEWRISNEWANCHAAISVTDAVALRDTLLKQPVQSAGVKGALSP